MDQQPLYIEESVRDLTFMELQKRENSGSPSSLKDPRHPWRRDMARDHRFTDSQLRKSEIGVVRTCKVRVHERIIAVDQRSDPDHSSGKQISRNKE
jgi:hypothetical protein